MCYYYILLYNYIIINCYDIDTNFIPHVLFNLIKHSIFFMEEILVTGTPAYMQSLKFNNLFSVCEEQSSRPNKNASFS